MEKIHKMKNIQIYDKNGGWQLVFGVFPVKFCQSKHDYNEKHSSKR